MSKKRGETLAADLTAAVNDARGKKTCRLCEVLASIDAGPAGIIREAVGALEPVRGRSLIGPRKLYEILQRNGYEVPVAHIITHRQEGHQ